MESVKSWFKRGCGVRTLRVCSILLGVWVLFWELGEFVEGYLVKEKGLRLEFLILVGGLKVDWRGW